MCLSSRLLRTAGLFWPKSAKRFLLKCVKLSWINSLFRGVAESSVCPSSWHVFSHLLKTVTVFRWVSLQPLPNIFKLQHICIHCLTYFLIEILTGNKTSTTPSCSGPIPAQKSWGSSVLEVVSSHTMPKMNVHYSHRFSWEKTHQIDKSYAMVISISTTALS